MHAECKTEILISEYNLDSMIKIHDIQSEEAIVVSGSIPKVDYSDKEWQMKQLSCKFPNVVKKQDALSN